MARQGFSLQASFPLSGRSVRPGLNSVGGSFIILMAEDGRSWCVFR